MENERKESEQIESEQLLDKLAKPTADVEIGADEHAVSAAGLTHPNDLELERIMSEVREQDDVSILDDTSSATPTEPADATQQFARPQEASRDNDSMQATAAMPDFSSPAVDNTPSKPVIEEKSPSRSNRKKQNILTRLGIPDFLATVIWLVIIISVGVSLGRMMWVCCADVMAFGKDPIQAVITIEEGEGISSVSKKLSDAGLIRYPGLFRLFADITGKSDNITAGTFTLSAQFDYNAMINAMGPQSQSRETVEIMFPEGYSCAQIFKLLEKKGVCTVAELEEYAANGELKEYWFLEGVQRGDKYCLEGYLFPDTYTFYTNDKPGRVLEKFLNAFDARYTDLMKAKLEPLNERIAKALKNRGYDQAYINAHKITIREIVIIASMIEKETAGVDESYTISSVIYNRLTNPGAYPYLNIDATIIYALGGNIDPETGESKPLTKEDLNLDSPYNTYTNAGLIPGPISNPGRNSLDAALDPLETGYYYYVYNPVTRKHLFAKTKSEHDNNIAYVESLDK